jgi:hypothetical protein
MYITETVGYEDRQRMERDVVRRVGEGWQLRRITKYADGPKVGYERRDAGDSGLWGAREASMRWGAGEHGLGAAVEAPPAPARDRDVIVVEPPPRPDRVDRGEHRPPEDPPEPGDRGGRGPERPRRPSPGHGGLGTRFVAPVLAHRAELDAETREWAANLTPHVPVGALAESPDRDIRDVELALRRPLVYPGSVTGAGLIGTADPHPRAELAGALQ